MNDKLNGLCKCLACNLSGRERMRRLGAGRMGTLRACLGIGEKRYAYARKVVPLSLFWVLLFVAVFCAVSRADTFTSLVSFVGPTDGISSYASVIQASDGNLYGTTAGGGPYELGTIFKMTTAGALTTLHSFRGADGANPYATLIQATDGNLYGTTYAGGAHGNGTIFKITTAGAFTTLYSFSALDSSNTNTDGANPYAALVQATDGNLYGTTEAGGYQNVGAIFKITTGGAFTPLHGFNGTTEGAFPYASLVQATDGNLYGTISENAIYKITTGGTFTILHKFSGSDGLYPLASLIQGTDGNLYGTTSNGGSGNSGTVFKITTGGALTTLYNFSGSDGMDLWAPLIQAKDGNFYGTTTSGGTNGLGTVFKLTTGGTHTTLYSFAGQDGESPYASLFQATDGNLYGLTESGGSGGFGTAFTMTTAGALTTLYNFSRSGSNGANPKAALMQAKDGKLYGTTMNGGLGNYGSAFKMTTAGALTTLYSFHGTDGANPVAPLIQASDGNLYGTTSWPYYTTYYGTVFKLTTGGVLTTLHSFHNTDGLDPRTALIQATDGSLYGTTYYGGAYGDGTIFKITTGGALTTLYSFDYTDGEEPAGALIQATDGNLYGTTASGGTYGNDGTVFKLTTGGALTTIHSFSGKPDGDIPYAPLVQAADGNLYGTTWYGGTGTGPYGNGAGSVFKVTGGALTILYSFNVSDGYFPTSALIQASDGNLYGTTVYGGASGDGTVFKLTTAGALTTLYSFSGGADGSGPYAALVQANDGNLYGTTFYGGTYGLGTIFRIQLSTLPVLASLAPASCNAAGPGFTLVVKGSNFTNSSVVHWTAGTTNTALTTTYVSATELKAAVPASLIANPGKASITVATANGTSNSKPFTILLTTLKLTSAALTKTSTGAYTATISLKNVGYLSAPNVAITKAGLGTASTSTTLPVSLGTIAAGATASTSLNFPSSAGTTGQVVYLKVSGTFTGGKFNGSLKLTLP